MVLIPELAEPLADGHIALRQSAERDIPEILIAYQDDPRMHERLGERRAPSGAELGREAERADAEREAGERVALTIVESGHDDCRGRITVHHINWDHARADLGIWVAPQLRNQGIGRRALALCAAWLFSACGVERLQLLTDSDNEALLRAARATGMVREGLLRGYCRRATAGPGSPAGDARRSGDATRPGAAPTRPGAAPTRPGAAPTRADAVLLSLLPADLQR